MRSLLALFLLVACGDNIHPRSDAPVRVDPDNGAAQEPGGVCPGEPAPDAPAPDAPECDDPDDLCHMHNGRWHCDPSGHFHSGHWHHGHL